MEGNGRGINISSHTLPHTPPPPAVAVWPSGGKRQLLLPLPSQPGGETSRGRLFDSRRSRLPLSAPIIREVNPPVGFVAGYLPSTHEGG
jgi:hypothetical protein